VFPIPRVHKETIMKAVKHLKELGVLEWQPSSDFRELNKRLVRKPFPKPKFSTVLQEIRGNKI
jgi:hypothetical protein